MTVRRLQGDGDIATQGRQFVYDMEDCAQTLGTRLKLFYGEYFRDINEGTDWFGKILLKGSPDNVKDAEIRTRIQNYADVRGIAEYSSSFDVNARRVTVRATVLTSYGQTKVTFEETI